MTSPETYDYPALIGMACRFPGARNPREFAELLRNGLDAVSVMPENRGYFYPEGPPPRAVWSGDAAGDANAVTRAMHERPRGGFLNEPEYFDADFFGISHREARAMDPQQRIMLELSWRALEDAGIIPGQLAGEKVGVFVGATTLDFALGELNQLQRVDAHSNTGAGFSILSNRIANFHDLRGPALTVDTACSSSLTALDLALNALENDECYLALVGGVNLVMHPAPNASHARAGLLARDGHCKPFAQGADGIVRSEGAGMIVVRKRAMFEDDVYAYFRATAVAQDGRGQGLMAPNGKAQEYVLQRALEKSRINPDELYYVEAHGTGTAVGDRIEARALGAIYGKDRSSERPLRIGSVKGNIGHPEAAAGMAGIIKTALMLKYGEIWPTIHSEPASRVIDFKKLRLRVQQSHENWPRGETLAGVSSFGFGGTNTHAVLQAPPRPPPSASPETISDAGEAQVLTLSAHDLQALREIAQFYLDYIDLHDVDLRELCRGAALRRSLLEHRASLVFRDRAELRYLLDRLSRGEVDENIISGRVPRNDKRKPHKGPVFLFSGQGAGMLDIAKDLPMANTAFRRALQECQELLLPRSGWRLMDRLLQGDFRIDDPEFVQPAHFAVQIGLAEAWLAKGVEPSAVVGHSLGEIAAACMAGALNKEDALRLVHARGRSMAGAWGGGAMLYVGLSAEAARAYVEPSANEGPSAQNEPSAAHAEAIASSRGSAAIAAVNDPSSVVIAGDKPIMEDIVATMTRDGVFFRKLDQLAVAGHGPQLREPAEKLREALANLKPAETRVPFYSSVRGEIVPGGELDADYWVRNMRDTVRFDQAVDKILDDGRRFLVEINSRPLLSGAVQRCAATRKRTVSCRPTLVPDTPPDKSMAWTAGSLLARGCEVNANKLHSFPNRDVAFPIPKLPKYPFRRILFPIGRNSGGQSNSAGKNIFQAATTSARRQAGSIPLDLDLNAHRAMVMALEEKTPAILADALKRLGYFPEPGHAHRPEQLAPGIQPRNARLIGRWFRLLEKKDYLVREGDGSYKATELFPVMESIMPPEALVESLRPICRAAGEPFEYLQYCIENLTDILRGEKDALHTLFPEGSYKHADLLYQKRPTARYMNEIVAAAATPGTRILEVGAGTGGTTGAILDRLGTLPHHYTFTDLSDFFLEAAARKFAGRVTEFARLNLEEIDDFQGHNYDVIVAANVVHACGDLRTALRNIRYLLRPGGILILLETTRYRAWFDFTAALISAWDAFQDDVRGEHPLLSAPRWLRLLGENGFSDAGAFPENESPLEILDQHVIIARRGEEPTGTTAAPDLSMDDLPAPTPVPPAREPFADTKVVAPSPPPNDASREAERMETRASSADAPLTADPETLIKYLRDTVAEILGRPAGSLNIDAALVFAGFDSLMALELKNRLEDELGQELGPEILRGETSIRSMAEQIAPRLAEDNRVLNEFTGSPLSPPGRELELFAAQQWFFEQKPANPHHWNTARILIPGRGYDAREVLEAFRIACSYHDAFHTVFRETEKGMRQVPGTASRVEFDILDFQEQREDVFLARVEEVCANYQRGLDIHDGPIARMAAAVPGRAGLPRIIVVIHHLVFDEFSWGILLDDVENILRVRRDGGETRPRRIPVNYGAWHEAMADPESMRGLEEELPYWRDTHARGAARLATDFPEGESREGSARTMSRALTRDETLQLSTFAESLSGGMRSILLWGLNRSFKAALGAETLLVELQDHARDFSLDLSRTIAFCANMYPFLLPGAKAPTKNTATAAEEVRALNALLGGIPGGGRNYHLLRYKHAAGRELRGLPAPEVKFIYRGDIGLADDALFRAAPESTGPDYAPENRAAHKLYLYPFLRDEQLHLEIVFSEDVFRAERMEGLMEAMVEGLNGLIV